jgi:hypothetical protein
MRGSHNYSCDSTYHRTCFSDRTPCLVHRDQPYIMIYLMLIVLVGGSGVLEILLIVAVKFPLTELILCIHADFHKLAVPGCHTIRLHSNSFDSNTAQTNSMEVHLSILCNHGFHSYSGAPERIRVNIPITTPRQYDTTGCHSACSCI